MTLSLISNRQLKEYQSDAKELASLVGIPEDEQVINLFIRNGVLIVNTQKVITLEEGISQDLDENVTE